MYCTLNDITERFPEKYLVQLTDDKKLGTVDQDVVNNAIQDADEEIDGYLRGRYTLPLDTVPNLVKKISVDIAIYNLYTRKSENVPETREKRYANAVKLLKQINQGLITLGNEDGDAPEPGQYKSNKNSESRTFSKDVLDKF
jgi:phage gp36-like protein